MLSLVEFLFGLLLAGIAYGLHKWYRITSFDRHSDEALNVANGHEVS